MPDVGRKISKSPVLSMHTAGQEVIAAVQALREHAGQVQQSIQLAVCGKDGQHQPWVAAQPSLGLYIEVLDKTTRGKTMTTA